MFALSDARELSSLQVLYRKIPKISPSMCPQNRNAKTSPPNISPCGGGACTWNLPSNTKSINKAKMVNFLPTASYASRF